ncbi:hypothetical protein C8Q73DRAFT_126868 [Cubamyces lactineus]|nr:hypothetical protein C8Q73DRAFT_126868 [Cubamyces lactineus]
MTELRELILSTLLTLPRRRASPMMTILASGHTPDWFPLPHNRRMTQHIQYACAFPENIGNAHGRFPDVTLGPVGCRAPTTEHQPQQERIHRRRPAIGIRKHGRLAGI